MATITQANQTERVCIRLLANEHQIRSYVTVSWTS